MKTIVHVNQHVIKANRKTGKTDPVLTVKTYKTNDYAREVEITGPCKVGQLTTEKGFANEATHHRH